MAQRHKRKADSPGYGLFVGAYMGGDKDDDEQKAVNTKVLVLATMVTIVTPLAAFLAVQVWTQGQTIAALDAKQNMMLLSLKCGDKDGSK